MHNTSPVTTHKASMLTMMKVKYWCQQHLFTGSRIIRWQDNFKQDQGQDHPSQRAAEKVVAPSWSSLRRRAPQLHYTAFPPLPRCFYIADTSTYIYIGHSYHMENWWRLGNKRTRGSPGLEEVLTYRKLSGDGTITFGAWWSNEHQTGRCGRGWASLEWTNNAPRWWLRWWW